MHPPANAAPKTPQRDVRLDAERVEQLLGELQTSSGPSTWPRVEELVHRLLRLQGEALERLLNHATAAGASGQALASRVSDDEHLASVLLVHGLHPLPVEARIERALAKVRPYLGSHSGGVELLRIDGEGRAHLKLVGSCQGCPSSRATAEGMLRSAVEDAAPELTGVEVEGVTAPGLVQLKEPGRRWLPLDGVGPLPPNTHCAIEVGGVAVLLVGGEGNPRAYRNRCPGCSQRLEGAQLEGDVLTCAGCGRHFDVAHAGRGVQGTPLMVHLDPLPVLGDWSDSGSRGSDSRGSDSRGSGGALRISLPEVAG